MKKFLKCFISFLALLIISPIILVLGLFLGIFEAVQFLIDTYKECTE